MKIITNPKWTQEEVDSFHLKIKENNGYCPCMLVQNDNTKCMCDDFRLKIKDKNFEGLCYCGLYYKQL